VGFATVGEALAQAQPGPTLQQRAAMLREWMQASQMQIRAYEWIETTVVMKDDEEQSRKQNRCFYGADGQFQKIEISESGEQKGGPPGILPIGRIARRIAEEERGRSPSTCAMPKPSFEAISRRIQP